MIHQLATARRNKLNADRSAIEGIIAARLQKLRALRRLSQSQVAKRCGIPAPQISHYETGRKTPTIATLQKILRAYEVTLSRFFGRWENDVPVAMRCEHEEGAA